VRLKVPRKDWYIYNNKYYDVSQTPLIIESIIFLHFEKKQNTISSLHGDEMQQDRQSESSARGLYKSVVTFFDSNKKAGALPSNSNTQ